jgi:hypothetical protein
VFTGRKLPALTPAGRKLFPEWQRLRDFIVERHNVYLRRAAGLPKPWTEDAMLQSYRFTNVYRELDRETEWLFDNWLAPNAAEEDLWFLSFVARHINLHTTLEQIGLPLPWNAEDFNKDMEWVAEQLPKVFSSAYMINQTIPGGKGLSKAAYLSKYVFSPAWKQRELLRARRGELLEHFHDRLMNQKGLGSFMAAQVVADVKWFMGSTPDFHTWAAPGPGSLRGLSLVKGLPAEQRWRAHQWLAELQWLREEINGVLPPGWQPLDAQNLQNCLCEFSKYIRGYSRQRFPGV